jgi:hypothetical protein
VSEQRRLVAVPTYQRRLRLLLLLLLLLRMFVRLYLTGCAAPTRQVSASLVQDPDHDILVIAAMAKCGWISTMVQG